MQEQKQEFEIIYNMLKENPRNYLGYKKLGEFYQKININQAFVCYEQALGECLDIEERKKLEGQMRFCQEDENFQVHPASFVILSYNAREMMIDCLESIRNGCVSGSYEIVVVDNDSRDGIRDYLTAQKDLILQLNDHNTGFAEGCNQGVKLANPYNDIFLLNNDTIVPPLALFYMRLALYGGDNIASVGAMSNAVSISQLDMGNFQSKEQWLEHAKEVHLPSLNPIEEKVWLSGFALLIKRKNWDAVGCLDEGFIRGYFEDADYGFRLLMAGYRNVLCHNSFIYHYGSVSMLKDPNAYNISLENNKQRLIHKLGFDFNLYMANNYELIDMIDKSRGSDEPFSVLEVGSGFGAMLSRLKYRYPQAFVAGIEENINAVRVAKNVTNVICANVEKDILPFESKMFDYIFLPKGLGCFEDTPKAIVLLKRYLKDSGKFIILTENPLRKDIFLGILKGKWETIGAINRRNKHFYTWNEAVEILSRGGISIQFWLKMMVGDLNVNEEERKLSEAIKQLPGVVVGQDLNAVSYIIVATLSQRG